MLITSHLYKVVGTEAATHMVNEFLSALVEDRDPWPNAKTSANWTLWAFVLTNQLNKAESKLICRLLPFETTKRLSPVDGLFRVNFSGSALALHFRARRVFGANERLSVAGIGAGGKGAVDFSGCSRENIVVMADVDYLRAETSLKCFDKATRYNDFRKMLEKEGGI